MSQLLLGTKLKLALGKARRFYIHTFNRDYIRRNRGRVRGECRRCGACCTLMFDCPFLHNSNEVAHCIRHETRPRNCRVFPIDEQDIKDRDLVSRNGPCGFHFDPPMGLQRWLVWFLAALAGLASMGSVSRRATAAGPRAPASYATDFRGEKLPAPWHIESGLWEPREDGRLVREAGELRTAGLALAGDDVRIELWAEFVDIEPGRDGDGRQTLTIERGCRRAAVIGPGGSVPTPGEAASAPAIVTAPRGRFRMVVECDGGLATAAVGRRERVRWREVFRADAGCASGEVAVRADAGVVVHAIRIRTRAGRRRPEPLGSGDRLYLAGDLGPAGALYAEALLNDELARIERAEAACKYGLVLAGLGAKADAGRAWGRALSLDPDGPWGERSRLALARTALAEETPLVALGLAREVATRSAPGIEEWAEFCEVVERARAALGDRHALSGATQHLIRMAEQMEWAGSPRARVLWAWGEVAAAYEARGWRAEAAAVRERASGLF